MSDMHDDQLYLNGLDADSGEYLLQTDIGTLARVIRGQGPEAEPKTILNQRKTNDDNARAVREALVGQGHVGTVAGIDVHSLAETGWGVIFAHDADPAIRDALRELLDLRREQCNGTYEQGGRYREYSGLRAYRPGESTTDFTSRLGSSAVNAVDPKKMPYYLLIVGSPEQIPFRFQYQLDVQFAVGRIYFDTIAEYAAYARSVVAAETGSKRRARRATFFGVQNQNDVATELSRRHLVQPLFEAMREQKPTWEHRLVPPEQALRSELLALLGQDRAAAPALLFAAAHGLSSRPGPDQVARQGALVCGDWPGPLLHRGPIPPEFYVAADHISDDADLSGMIAFFYACYGAGTPMMDDFDYLKVSERRPIAEQAFLARLPQRMLTHPNPSGGALAVIGHVERAWGVSFHHREQSQIEAFQSTMLQLMEGYPVGAALEFFNQRYAALGSELSTKLEPTQNPRIGDHELVALWTANNDARGYIIIGDPAVRLRFEAAAQPGVAIHNISRCQPTTLPATNESPLRSLAQTADQQWQALLQQAFHTLTDLALSVPERRQQLVAALIGILASDGPASLAAEPGTHVPDGAKLPERVFTLDLAGEPDVASLPGGWQVQRFTISGELKKIKISFPDICWRGRLDSDPQHNLVRLAEAEADVAAARAALPQLSERLEQWLAKLDDVDAATFATVEGWCLRQIDALSPYAIGSPVAKTGAEPPAEELFAYIMRNLLERRVRPALQQWRASIRKLQVRAGSDNERRSLWLAFKGQPNHLQAMQWLTVQLTNDLDTAARQMQEFLKPYTRVMTRKAGAREPDLATSFATATNRQQALDLLAITGVNVMQAVKTDAERARSRDPLMANDSTETNVMIWDPEAKAESDNFVAISDIDWEGNVMTDWRSQDEAELAAHQRLVALALASRSFWLERFTSSWQVATSLAKDLAAAPAAAELAPLLAWFFVHRVAPRLPPASGDA